MSNSAPLTTSDMVFANSTSQNQVSAILSGAYPFPSDGKTAICLYGTYGTGKTTYSHIFCREFEQSASGEDLGMMPHFISCQKTEAIDALLKPCERMTKHQSFNKSGYHYFIFDEVDNLTEGGQKALKAFFNKTNVVCVLTTNYLDKLDKGLLDRCVRINFNAADTKSIRTRVQDILQSDGLNLEQDAIDEIVERSDGSWREILPTVRMSAKSIAPPRPPLYLVK